MNNAEIQMITEPLVAALAAGEAVAFVGAGASVPSRLPLWRKFLKDFLDYAKKLDPSDDWTRAETFLNDGDFLLAAEILQRKLPIPTFESYIKQIFGSTTRPNDIHKSIARLPFTLVLTTNFDTLLETAHHTSSHTWKNTAAVFRAIRSKAFGIVKVHGSIDDPETLRITRSDYRDSSFKNLEFNECLKALLTWKTFLFIGHSLRDSDLLRLMDETKIRFGDRFGPHYALMPRYEVDSTFRAYLKDALSIECITYEVDRNDQDGHTKSSVAILKTLAGAVAKRILDTQGIGIKGFSTPRVEPAAHFVLADTVRLLGSTRGDVYMIRSDVDPELRMVTTISQHEPSVKHAPILDMDSVVHTTFLQTNALTEKDYIYITDTSRQEEELKAAGYLNAHYVICDSSIQSEIAYPIIADGRRIGVLNVESDLVDAYTPDHIDVIAEIARQLGQLYLQPERRRRAAEPLGGYYRRPSEFVELLNNSRLLRTMNHDFLLYEVDYEQECLIAHRANDSRPFSWSLSVPSLARQVLEERKNVFISDVRKEISSRRSTQLNLIGLDHFKIEGPLFACPVRPGGQTEAILVTWLKPASHLDSRDRPQAEVAHWFWSSCGQASRLANLLANDVSESGMWRAKTFLTAFYDSLDEIDAGKLWSRGRLQDTDFRQRLMYALMNALLHDSCGLLSVRVWGTTRGYGGVRPANLTHRDRNGFTIIDSLTKAGKTAPGKPNRGAYTCTTSEMEVYSRYTIARFGHDPFARWQHPAMFGQKDRDAEILDKDPAGPWIVAPIVRPTYRGSPSVLLGYVSADSHDRSSGDPKNRPEQDTRVIMLQCRMMDLIADLARHVVEVELAQSRVADRGGRIT
jgi:NAD-dependent SIR2 family protein deacetylase